MVTVWTIAKVNLAGICFLCSIVFVQTFETLSRCVFGQLIKGQKKAI